MVYKGNTVRKRKTALENLKSVTDVPANMLAFAEMARTFAPDVVISDFESMSWFAKLLVDRQASPRCLHSRSG